MVFADEGGPAFLAGGFEVLQAAFRDEPKIAEAFRTGGGVGWHEHDACLFRGTERFFRPGYNAHLVAEWIPALEGVEDKLKAGAVVADVGCGHGASTMLMAQAYPNSRFTGFDYHPASIERARELAAEAGVADRASFEVAMAQAIPGGPYDLICIFDALHDMGDPVGAARLDPRAAEAGRDLDAGRALRPRRAGRQPQSGRADVLCGLDHDLHAGLAEPGGRHGPGRPGRRGAAAARSARRPASPASAARRRRRSTWCSRSGP